MDAIAHWISNHMFPCFYKQVFGFSCPMCGSQRAVALLCQGRVWESLRMFPPLAPLAITLLVLVLRPFVPHMGKG